MIDNRPMELSDVSFTDSFDEHTVPATCRKCYKRGDLVCPHCGSLDVEPDDLYVKDRKRLLENIRRLLITADKNRCTAYWVQIILLATGDPAAEGVSLSDVAKNCKVTRAKVSKDCAALCERLNISPSEYMKSEEARDSYRESNRRPAKI